MRSGGRYRAVFEAFRKLNDRGYRPIVTADSTLVHAGDGRPEISAPEEVPVSWP